MYALYACVAHQHDLRLVILAAVVCLLGVYATFSLATYAFFSKKPREQRLWAGATVVSSATSTWATHFIAMLAFHPGVRAGFEPVLTALSFLVALAMIGGGIGASVFARSKAALAAGGLVIGLGISAMHYIGMAAYEVAGWKVWDWSVVAVSVGCSVAFACAGALLALSANRALRALAPPAMLLAICSLHFVGMSAVTIVADPLRELPPNTVQPYALALFVTAATLLVSVLAVAGGVLHRSSKRRRRLERQRLGALADVALEGLMICEDDRIVSANRSLAALCGVDAHTLIGSSAAALFEPLAEGLAAISEQDAILLGQSGATIPVRVLRRALTLHERPHHVIAVRDQRERLATEARIRSLAFVDPLTQLPNRAQFQADLEAQIAGRGYGENAFAVMIIDLDRFKLVNDTLGHGVGDLLLKRAAGRLHGALDAGDAVARLGGDEFAILQVSASDLGQTRALAARVVELLSRPFILEGHVVNVGASVGVAMAPSDGETPRTLMRNADLALYKAKGDGRGAFRMFDASLDAHMQQRRGLELDLRRAVAQEDFELHYQPLLDARSGQVSGAEALIRWRHAERGLVSPADFIPLAEETGLITNIGQWVLRTACEQAVAWPAHMTVAVNLSPIQFRDARLAETIQAVLASTGLAPGRLELEITEGVLLADEARTLQTLQELRQAGVRISMDDFGTGYSSLSYLRRFPFDKIKIDQSFIRQIPHDAESAAIVRAIITMSACLGLKTTVEGVETAEQLAFTSSEGCDQVQGFLLSKPLPPATFAEFIADRRAAA
ncbi:MAG: EAL domain-containing protein [Caulobacteraceae bacterium]|nr:EAL domain-containing protein [Caulobacter sp.]